MVRGSHGAKKRLNKGWRKNQESGIQDEAVEMDVAPDRGQPCSSC